MDVVDKIIIEYAASFMMAFRKGRGESVTIKDVQEFVAHLSAHGLKNSIKSRCVNSAHCPTAGTHPVIGTTQVVISNRLTTKRWLTQPTPRCSTQICNNSFGAGLT
jgi:hypothetical protein